MFPRRTFLPGLLVGGFLMFTARRCWLPASKPRQPDPLLDLVSDAVLVSDASGMVTYANAAAKALFGSDGQGVFQLRYPSGQPVPPGQIPLNLVRRTGSVLSEAEYLPALPSAEQRILQASALPLADGHVAAFFRDITVMNAIQARGEAARKREQVLNALSLRLSLTVNPDETCRGIVESALTLLGNTKNGQARLYAYDRGRKLLTRLASAPEDRPKRPRSLRQAQPVTLPFDAGLPMLWALYVERKPAKFEDGYAVPLLCGETAIGHLEVFLRTAFGLEEKTTLETLAALAALALTRREQAARAEVLSAMQKAIQTVSRLLSERMECDMAADRICGLVREVTGCEICTLALADTDGLRLRGTLYREALLSPDDSGPSNAASITEAARKAMATRQTIIRSGLPNPTLTDGPWRAFAGQSGRHSLLSVPLPQGRGALTVYAVGAAGFTMEQRRFLETLALLSAAMPTEERTDP